MSEAISIGALLPEILLVVAGCAVLLLGQARAEIRRLAPWVSLIALVLAVLIVHQEVLWANILGDLRTAGSGLAYGSMALFVRLSALILGIILTLVNWSQAPEGERGEFLSMMLFSITGLLLVGPANDLLVLFLALELVSIPTYIMVVLSRTNVRGLEAGTKYFYLGAFSAAIMAYGFSFLYGVSGTAALDETVIAVSAALRNPGTLEFGLAMVGVVVSLGGLLFKIAAVPLHFYIADVYEGAASPVAGLLGFVPKLAGLVAIIKIIVATNLWTDVETPAFMLLWIVAVASMIVGNVLALRQSSIKRMLAYSGVAHSGYMLVGLIAGPLAGQALDGSDVGILGNGVAAVLYYVVVYGLANLAAFAILGVLRGRQGECETLRDIAGLLRREPVLALLMALAMFTLMGLPPTPGFWGKLTLFSSALAAAQNTMVDGRQAWMIALVIIGVLNSALAAAYYLRVIAAVLLYENKQPAQALPREAQNVGALLCGFLLLIFAFWPSGLFNTAETGSQEVVSKAAHTSTPWAWQPSPEGPDEEFSAAESSDDDDGDGAS